MKNWDKLRNKCSYQESCDCGLSLLCSHPQQEETDLCEEESCPLMKEKNENN
jgi:hypothetical protein